MRILQRVLLTLALGMVTVGLSATGVENVDSPEWPVVLSEETPAETAKVELPGQSPEPVRLGGGDPPTCNPTGPQVCFAWGQRVCNGGGAICVCTGGWSWSPGTGFVCTGGGTCDCA